MLCVPGREFTVLGSSDVPLGIYTVSQWDFIEKMFSMVCIEFWGENEYSH